MPGKLTSITGSLPGTEEVAGNRVNTVPSNAIHPQAYTSQVNLVPTTPIQNVSVLSQGTGNVWSWRTSPVPWIIVLLFVGYLGLRYIHFKPPEAGASASVKADVKG